MSVRIVSKFDASFKAVQPLTKRTARKGSGQLLGGPFYFQRHRSDAAAAPTVSTFWIAALAAFVGGTVTYISVRTLGLTPSPKVTRTEQRTPTEASFTAALEELERRGLSVSQSEDDLRAHGWVSRSLLSALFWAS